MTYNFSFYKDSLISETYFLGWIKMVLWRSLTLNGASFARMYFLLKGACLLNIWNTAFMNLPDQLCLNSFSKYLMMIIVTHRTTPPTVDSAPLQVVVLENRRSLFAVYDVKQWRVWFLPVWVKNTTTAVWHTSWVMPTGTRYTGKVLTSSFSTGLWVQFDILLKERLIGN